MPCDFLPIGTEGATLDELHGDSAAQCSAELLVGRRTAEGDEFVGVFHVVIAHESWGDIEGVYRDLSEGGDPVDLGDEAYFKVDSSGPNDYYEAAFLKGPYSASVGHGVMDPSSFVEDTARTRELTVQLARAIDEKMDAAGVGSGAAGTPGSSPTDFVPVDPGSVGSSDDGGDSPIGPIVATTVVVIGGTAVTINVLRRRRPPRVRSPGDPGQVPRCWDEVGALDDAARRLDTELDDLRRARDSALDRIGRIERALDAERSLGDAFGAYGEAVIRSQQVHKAGVYGDTALLVSAIFTAGAAGIEMLNAWFGVQAAVAPEVAALTAEIEQGVAASRAAAQAAARLPELQSRLASIQQVFGAARGAELSMAAAEQVVAAEQAVAAAESAISVGAAAAEAAPGLLSQLARLTSTSLPAELWAKAKATGMLFSELAGSNAVSASRAAEGALGRLAPEQQKQLFEETMRAMDIQRDLVTRAREMAENMRRELETLRSDVAKAEALVTGAERKIAEVAARRAAKAAECEQLAAAAAAATGGTNG